MTKKITAVQATKLSPATVATLYNTLSKCADFFAGMPYSIEDCGIHPDRALERADRELRKKGKESEYQEEEESRMG